ncbi:MAG: DNA methyltransferase [Acidimicrobiales bacterium]
MTRHQGRGTSTSIFGVGRRETHDASAFYARFTPKQVSDDEEIAGLVDLEDPLVCGDAREMHLPDNSVALVVTSPPYFAGKEYEEALGQGAIPASYAEYLRMLRDVFAECVRVLEPGGRIAVNVANLGRKPYRSLAGDVARILDDDLGLFLRGEVVWAKAEGASGSCAWGSYRSPTNPVLRDVTERIVIASKGRFDRAVNVERRRAQGLPHEASISTDEFLDASLDLWRIPPESARRVGHPAPFPVELPQRLIELYTFRDDLVLDPFLGSGTTAVAAVKTGRRFAGYDTDPKYVALAKTRVAELSAARLNSNAQGSLSHEVHVPVRNDDDNFQSRAFKEGKAAQALALDILTDAGFKVRHRNRKLPGLGVTISVVADDADGKLWYFDVTGAFTSTRAGLVRTDTLWKCLGRVSVLASATKRLNPLVLISSHLPPRRGTGDRALHAVGPESIHDVIGMLIPEDRQRLADYAAGGHHVTPLAGFWTETELGHVFQAVQAQTREATRER